MKCAFPIVFILILLLITSCEYEPEGEVYTEVSDTNTKIPRIILDEYTSDTIYINDFTIFNFELAPDSLQIFYLTVFVNSTLIDSLASTDDYFIIDPDDYSNGFCSLRIEITANSNTGSLADIGGLEARVFTYEYILGIETSVEACIALHQPYKTNEGIVLSWNKFPGHFFDEYRIKTYYHYNFDPIEDIHQTSLIDNYFLGGIARYTIQARSGSSYSPICDTAYYEDDYLRFHNLQRISNSEVEVSWTKCPYEQAFGRYALYQPYVVNALGGSQYTYSVSIDQVTDTSAIANLFFGYPLELIISVTNDHNVWYFHSTDYIQAPYFSTFSQATASSNASEVILINNNQINKVRVPENQTILSTQIPNPFSEETIQIEISEDHEFLALFAEDNLTILNVSDLRINKIINLEEYGLEQFEIREVQISNTNLLKVNYGLDYWVNHAYTYGYIIIDLENDEIIKHEESQGAHFCEIATSGQYIVDKTHGASYLLQSDGFGFNDTLGSIPHHTHWSYFDEANNEVYCASQERMFVCSLSDFSVKRSYPFTFYSIVNYNPHLSSLFYNEKDGNNNFINILNPSNGNIEDRISVACNNSMNQFSYYSVGNYLIASSGYLLELLPYD